MAGLFVDTWGWLALRDKGDRKHKPAVAAFEEALKQRERIVTTDYVLDEAFTLFFRRLAIHKAKESLEFLMAATEDGSVLLAPVSAARFREAIKLRLKYKDKPEISFTDFTSMVVMQESGVKRVLTEDGHFVQVGLGFELVP
jgi:predicted nucleic acid-binding protein